MQILYFAPDVSINDGDARATHIREVVQNWANNGVRIIAVLRSPSPTLEKHKNIRIIPIGTYNEASPIRTIVHSIPVLLKTLLDFEVDRIYARHAYSLISLLFSKLTSTKHIVEVNGVMSEEQQLSTGSIYRYLYSKLTEASYNYSNYCICVSENTRDKLDIRTDKTTVVNNGVNTDLFYPIEKENACEEVGLHSEQFRVGFVGLISAWQGLDLLVNASQNISRDDIEFLIVGDGPEKDHIKQLAGKKGVLDKFIFTGRVKYEQVPFFINSMDVCVAPKVGVEGFSPLKMYEYMACGRPVIATNLDEFKLLEDLGAGETFNPEDPEGFSSSIKDCARNPKKWEEMGEKGRDYVERNQTWEAVSNQILKDIS